MGHPQHIIVSFLETVLHPKKKNVIVKSPSAIGLPRKCPYTTFVYRYTSIDLYRPIYTHILILVSTNYFDLQKDNEKGSEAVEDVGYILKKLLPGSNIH